MPLGLIGRKLGMTQLFFGDGVAIPITVIEAGPCSVVQIKRKGGERYDTLQLGFLPKKLNKVNKPLQGHFKKGGASAFCFLKEFKTDDVKSYQLGQEINIGIFQVGQKVTVTGISKGKGFSGSMKRWGFKGGPPLTVQPVTARLVPSDAAHILPEYSRARNFPGIKVQPP